MSTWTRTTPLVVADGFEEWTSTRCPQKSYAVYVRRGKPVDLMSLKQNVLDDFAAQVAHISSTRLELFSGSHTEAVEACPICGAASRSNGPAATVYGAEYHQCQSCSHHFLKSRPRKESLEKFYATDTHYASTYTDPRITETRVQQVAMPKAEWMIGEFQRRYGRRPGSVLDVGAGGGHFVYACSRLGMTANGIELGEANRAFCMKTFGIELSADPFAGAQTPFADVDVVTFWGVLEHVPSPMALLRSARKTVHPQGLVVAAVPRWNCLSTAVQKVFPDSVVRHLDPLGHVSIFTDNSIATAFELAGFAPAAAWYFGMDAYELVMQLSYRLVSSIAPVREVLATCIAPLQAALDLAQISDEIALAAVPRS
ncbi:MAG: class I SAM-dependent methyltransferase [Terriglobia bacterium]